MSEAQRLTNSVPRGMVRFESHNIALAAKPVNDQIVVNITGSLPDNFAYILSALSYQIAVDTASDWDAVAKFRIFNGIPNVPPANEIWSVYNFELVPVQSAAVDQRILGYEFGSPRDWFPNPIWRNTLADGLSFTLNTGNGAAAVGAAGLMFFNCAFYQYDLTQAVRYPLNAPFPVGVR